MAGTNGRRAVVKPAAVVVEHGGKRVTLWFSTRPNAAIAEQMINSEYGDGVAELELHPGIHVNLSHGKIHALLSGLGMTRIPGDGEESDATPADAAEVADADTAESAPEPPAVTGKGNTRRATGTTTGSRRRATGG